MLSNIPAHGEIEFEDVGQGSVIVLLHAFPFSHRMWRPQITALQEHHHVVAPTLRGFGNSAGWKETPSIGRIADDVRALLDTLHIVESVTVCGLSMGGYVALAFARMFPRRVRALILADTRAEADSQEARSKRDDNIEFAREHSAHEFVERMLPNMISAQTRATQQETVREIVALGAAQPTTGIMDALRALRDRHDATSELVNIAAPTLVLVGSEDAITPLSAAQTLVDHIPQAQLQIIEGAGHLSNMEQPEQFNRFVLQFLKSL
jgi:pimeloyl-ACP methyl ester carboxylesterase